MKGERGSGLISTWAGVLVFMVLLLFSVQVVLHLYTSSTTGAVAADAAHRVARAADTEALAEDRARELLGSVGERAVFDWSGSTAEHVVVRVIVDNPDVLPGMPGLDIVDRTVRVRREQMP